MRSSCWKILGLVILSTLAGCASQADQEYKCVIEGNDCDKTDIRADKADTEIVVGPRGEAGADGLAGADGQDGLDGATGATGATGAAGQSCSVSPASNGALITCGESSVLVLNGTDGLNGSDGQDGEDGEDGEDAAPTPYAVASIIDPCGQQSNYDEILIQLANGQIIASFSQNASGLNTRFVSIGPGSYMTTDGTSCAFTVHSDLTVSW